jgi:predicted phosphate transport protein (TIGR00153 family)
VPFQVIPRELVFYDLLDQAAAGVEDGARELLALVDDLPNAEAHAEKIVDLEHAGDELTHRIIAKLNTTFVVPIDRGDIHRLASHLDDVLDASEAVSDLLVLHHMEETLPQFRQQVEVLVRAIACVRRAVHLLRTPARAREAIADVKREEREGDWIYHRAVAELFSGDYAAMEVLKWKDLLRQVEGAIDRCEDIANDIESVAAKFA